MKGVLTSATVKRRFVFVVVVGPISDSRCLGNGTSSRGPGTSRGRNRGRAVAIRVPSVGVVGHLDQGPLIYTGRGRVGKFKFVFVRRLHVAATLFCSELICSYITCILTILILRGKTTT